MTNFVYVAPITQKKLDFQQTLEQYLEEEKVHDIFSEMMKALIKDRPENPIEFLIQTLTAPERKRIVLILPPGLK